MRLARRALQPQPGASLPARDSGAVASRCHMGLTDYLVPVTVGGKPLAALIAGRRVETDEDRMRIRKIVGKLGKLTRAEAEKESAADRLIEPAEEKARDRLVQEIASIPLASPELERALSRLAKLLGRIASRGFEGSRRMVEDRIIERIDARMGEAPKQFGDLRRETSELLEEIKMSLGSSTSRSSLPRRRTWTTPMPERRSSPRAASMRRRRSASSSSTGRSSPPSPRAATPTPCGACPRFPPRTRHSSRPGTRPLA
jgi:hypothetical protein